MVRQHCVLHRLTFSRSEASCRVLDGLAWLAGDCWGETAPSCHKEGGMTESMPAWPLGRPSCCPFKGLLCAGFLMPPSPIWLALDPVLHLH